MMKERDTDRDRRGLTEKIERRYIYVRRKEPRKKVEREIKVAERVIFPIFNIFET